MMPMETIGLVIEKMRKRVSCAIGAAPAGFCRPSASNQPIWPRRATIMVTPGMVPLSMSRLNASDMRCNRMEESPSDSGLAWGSGGVRGAARRFGGGLRGHGLSLCFCSWPADIVGISPSLAQNIGIEQGVNRLARAIRLAIRPSPMLETARISGDAWFLQGCSSVGRVPVSKTGCRRFEPCRPCQPNP